SWLYFRLVFYVLGWWTRPVVTRVAGHPLHSKSNLQFLDPVFAALSARNAFFSLSFVMIS
ncbi:MAG: hypothetical protein P8Y00_03170, partial [Deltaproteobacteria bacterium]